MVSAMDLVLQTFIDCIFSIQRVLVGTTIAIIIGVLLGIARNFLPKKIKNNKIVNFIFEFPRFPPPIGWVPIVILFLGINEFSAYFIVFIGAFPPIFINTYSGIRDIPETYKNTARSMELSIWNYAYHVIFKSALPQIFVGIQVGVGMGWMSVIAAEMLSGENGLGYAIELYTLNLQFGLTVLNMIIIGIIGFFLSELVCFFKRLIIPWHDLGENND